METFRLLKENEIECKVKKTIQSGVFVLLYKTARTDMDLLDETVGPENWTCDYKEIKGNLYCGIGVWVQCPIPDGLDYGDWIYKWDCGIESREDGEGNEKKGEASDAFKRAGFKWGIGRELYTAPTIFIPVEKVYMKDGKVKDHFYVEKIAYGDDRNIIGLSIKSEISHKRVFVYTDEAADK